MKNVSYGPYHTRADKIPNGQNATFGSSLYGRVMLWLFAQFVIMAASSFMIAPFVPDSWVMPLGLLLIVSLLAASFMRLNTVAVKFFAVVVPLILGITVELALRYYVMAGEGDIILPAAVGAIAIFGTMAVIGFTSKKSLDSWSGKLFAILIGVIVMSVMNIWFQSSLLSLLVGIAALVIFSIYTFIDIQRVRNAADDPNAPAAMYALNIYLNIVNIFMALLRIFSYFR